jgi:predicted enzyme related to lactoylglutathione lyase
MQDTPGRLAWVQVDATDPEGQAAFWGALLQVEIEERTGETPNGTARYVVLQPQAGTGVGLCFQWVPEAKRVKNRLHLDVVAERGLEPLTDLAESLGGSRVPDGDFSEHGWRWRAMLDPEGNEFCLILSEE